VVVVVGVEVVALVVVVVVLVVVVGVVVVVVVVVAEVVIVVELVVVNDKVVAKQQINNRTDNVWLAFECKTVFVLAKNCNVSMTKTDALRRRPEATESEDI